MIKRLVDSGYAIGSIAALSLDQLQGILQQAAGGPHKTLRALTSPVEEAMHAVSVVVVGEALAMRVRRKALPELHIVATCPSAARAAYELRGVQADTLLIEMPSVQPEAPNTIRQLARQFKAQRVVVEYGFASRQLEQDLRALGCQLVRAPLNLDELTPLCRTPQAGVEVTGLATLTHHQTPPAPRFDSKSLAELSMTTVSLQCECPHHIAQLLVQLGNFEIYSAECEHRSPADAALHQYLNQVTGNARAMMEIALERVMEAEGMTLPKGVSA